MAESPTYTQIKDEIKDAMRARDTERTTTLRMLSASLKNKQIELLRELNEEDILSVLATEAKKRREAAQAYEGAGRPELAAQELRELAMIERYLPQQLTDEEVGELVARIVTEVGVTSKRDIGKVMSKLMPQIKGRFDGARVKTIVAAHLPD